MYTAKQIVHVTGNTVTLWQYLEVSKEKEGPVNARCDTSVFDLCRHRQREEELKSAPHATHYVEEGDRQEPKFYPAGHRHCIQNPRSLLS